MSAIIHKTTRADAETAELNVIFTALLDYFREDASVLPPEQIYRLFGVPHRRLLDLGWLKPCECGECGGGVVPAGALGRALDGQQPDAAQAPGPLVPSPTVEPASTPVVKPDMELMVKALRVMREQIENHWQELAGRMQAECWSQAEREAFRDGTSALYRESEALNNLLFEKNFSVRWL